MTTDFCTGGEEAARLGRLLKERSMTLAVAESCTGGLIGNLLTDVPGASDWFAGAVVAYANSAKTALLGVSAAVIEAHGAVSKETVEAMAGGARRAFGANCGLSVSGIAGPAGGTPEKPVGTVWIGCDIAGDVVAERHQFAGTRSEIKAQTAKAAIARLVDTLEKRE